MPSQSLVDRPGRRTEMLGTGEVVAEDCVIIPGRPWKAGTRSASSEDKRVKDALGEINAMIAENGPLATIIERTLTSIAELFGIEAMFFEITKVKAGPSLRWVTYGFPKESAEKIVANMRATYHPKD